MLIRYHSCCVFVDDILACRDFYEGVLGQVAEMEYEKYVSYDSGFSIMDRAYTAETVLGRAAGSGRDPLAFELYFEAMDIDAVVERMRERGVEFVHPVREQPWRQRCVRVLDPDGNIVEIAEPLVATVRRLLEQGLSPEEVSEQTTLPLDMVQGIADPGSLPDCAH